MVCPFWGDLIWRVGALFFTGAATFYVAICLVPARFFKYAGSQFLMPVIALGHVPTPIVLMAYSP